MLIDRNQIIQGDCLSVLKGMKNEVIDLTVTSPPYDNLRTYNGYSFDFEGIAKELYRVTEEQEKDKNIQKEREEAEEVTLIIRRLKEYGKYDDLFTIAKGECNPGAMTAMIDMRARMIVLREKSKYTKIVESFYQ